MIKTYLFIALGGALGSCLRFFLSSLMLNWLGKGFPFGTLLVNILGSLVMGFVYGLIQHEIVEIVPWRTFIGIGFLGALTTFSTFSLDSLLLLQQGEWVKASMNIVLNVFVCIFCAWLGMQSVTFIKG